MEVRSSTLTAFFQDLKTEFNNAYTEAQPQWNKVAMLVESASESNVYGWMEQLPGVREWIGARTFINLKSNGYTLTNKDFEESVQIKRTAIEDDTYGIYTPLTQQMAYNMAYHPDTQVYALLQNGFSDNGWDGQAFFSADHTLRVDQNGAAVTFTNKENIALSGANFATVRAALRRNLEGGDNPFMGNPEFLLVVPPELERTAREILEAEFDDLGQTNVNRGMASLHVSSQITTSTYWFLLVTNNPVKPLIYQLRERPRVHTPSPTDESVVETNYYKFMADYRAAFGYGLPILAYGSTGDA